MSSFTRTFKEHPFACGLGALFLILALLAIKNLTVPQNDPQLAAIRQAGYPVTLSELNTYYSAVPADQNAALVYQEVFEDPIFTNSVYEELTRNLQLTRDEPVPEAVREFFRVNARTNSAVWQALYKGTNFSSARYPLDFREGHMVMLPHLAKVKASVALLGLAAASHASDGDSNQAFAALNAALHTGESLREEPILISYLVRIACAAIVSKRLEHTLNLVELEEPALRLLQEQFQDLDAPEGPARALAGERAFGLSFFIDRHIQRSITQPNQGTGAGPGLGVGPSGVLGQLALTGYKASGLMSRDRAFYLNTLGQSIQLAEAPSQDRIATGAPPNLVTSNRFLFFSRMILPALGKTLDRANDHSARMRISVVALAVERYRTAHQGALPNSLRQLTPHYLQEVPLDPFDSKLIRYKKLPHGYAIYSVGADKADDGGAEPPPPGQSKKRTKAIANDLTFVVERQ